MTRIIGDYLGNSDVVGVDMNAWDFGELAAGTISAHTAESVTITSGDHTYVLSGEDFTFDTTGGSVKLTGGTLTKFTVYPKGSDNHDFFIHRFEMDIDRFNDFVADNNVHGFQRALLSESDGYRGGACIDTLKGMDGADYISGGDGNDILYGNKGDDELQGDKGADRLIGGTGDDRFYFAHAPESGNGIYDTIAGFNVNRDRVMVPVVVEGVDAAVNTSANPAANAEAALIAALPSDHLGAYHAAVATVSTGAGPEVFLVVDMNGVAGYQSGLDLAVRIDGSRDLATLDIDNFILLTGH